MRRLNVKLLVGLICGVLVTVVSVHVIHGMQIKKNAGVLLAEAQKSREDGDLREAVKKYSQYLKHRPDDQETQGEMALLAADIAERPDANAKDFSVAFRALESASRHPELTKVRRRHIDFLMRINRFIDAIDYLNEIREINESEGKVDPDIEIKFATCQVRTGHDDKAIAVLSRLVGYDDATQQFLAESAKAPQSVDAYVLLASLLRMRRDDAAHADAVMQQAVAANPDSAKAHLALGRYLQRYGKLEVATNELNTALKLSSDDADIILASAEVAIANKDFKQAHELLERGIDLHPKSEGMYRVASMLARAEGKPQQALERIREGLKAVPKSQMLLVDLAENQMQQQDVAGLRETTQKMRDENIRPEWIGFFETSIAVSERQWLKASRQLERLRSQLVGLPALQNRVDLWLGECYENLGQPDKQLEAYRRAIEADPTSLAGQMGHMRALARTGKQKEAAEKMRHIAEATSSNSGAASLVRNNILQLSISEETRKPVEERDWTEVDQTVEQMMADPGLTDVQKRVLTAEIMAVKGDVDKAQTELNAVVKKFPEEPTVWLANISMLQRQLSLALEKKTKESKGKLDAAQQRTFTKNSTAKVLQLLDRAEEAAGPQTAFRSLRAQTLARLDKKEAEQGLKKLEQGIGDLNETDRLTLWADLGNAYYRLRDYEDVRRCWQEVAAAKPKEPKFQQALFDLAREFSDENGMKEAADAIGKLVGTGTASYKYCQAALLVWDAQYGKKEKSELEVAQQLEAARKLVVEARRLRSEWHEPYRLEGEIDEKQGNLNAAIANYQKALELGPANPNTSRHLVLLLYRQGRVAEADKAMAQVGTTGDANDPLKKIDIERKLASKDADAVGAALDMAKNAVEEDTANAGNHLWYGQLLERANLPDDAEQQYKLATEHAPNMPQAWLMLVQQLVRSKKKTEALDVLKIAAGKVPDGQGNPLLAQGYELLGDRGEAEKYYLLSLRKTPNDSSALRALAVFYLRAGDAEKARPQIEKMLAIKPDAKDKATAANLSWGRRAMAEILARKGDFEDVRRAIKLIEENSPDSKPSSDDVLMLVTILSSRPEASSRERAVSLLEQLASQRTLTDREQVTLASLYERSGQWTKARDQMANLVARAGDNAGVLATYIQMLLRHDEVSDVNSWLTKLERLQPKTPTTLQLRARWLAKQGKGDVAVKYLKDAIPNPLKPEQLPILAAVANLLEELGQNEAAEKLLRQYYEREPKAILLLANFLGRHGNVDEAFALYGQATKGQETLAVLQGALQTLRARPEEVTPKNFATVETWINKQLDHEPDSAALLLDLAELRDLQGQLDKVIEIYRQVLALPNIGPKQQAIVRNNLAFSLATRGSKQDMAEAEKTIDESLAYLGPIADVLDTRGMVLLMKGDADRAVADIRAAVADVPSATKYLHLAMAENQAGNREAAAKALDQANEMKLDVKQLPPAEQKAYDRLQAEFDKK